MRAGMRRIVSILVASLLFAAVLGTGVHAQSLPATFDPKRNPDRDLATAVAQAKAEGKRVLVDVGGEWCSWCHLMDRFFAQDAEARALRDANYVWVKINYSPENKNARFLSRWPKIAGYPHLFVLDASGKLLHSQDTSELESGKGYSRERLSAFLERWKPLSRA
jgi:thiol:disulfide interchange protein